MCYLQLFAVLLNLFPVPPLDGFGIVAPYLREDLRDRVTTPPLSTMLFIGYFFLLQAPGFTRLFHQAMHNLMGDTLATRAFGGFIAVFFPEAFR
jgi:Zn-dependent protease